MIDFKYTKVNKILEVNNDMVHNFYYVYYGRIYNENKTKYRRFKYVESFDVFDVMEFFEKDFYTKEDVKEFARNLENWQLLSIKSYDDVDGLKEFYNFCNDSIKNYNKII